MHKTEFGQTTLNKLFNMTDHYHLNCAYDGDAINLFVLCVQKQLNNIKNTLRKYFKL